MQTLGQRWTVSVSDGAGNVLLPKFAPSAWTPEGKLSRGRISVLRSAGWEIRSIEGKRYLIPDEELARYAFGTAYDEYRHALGGILAAPPPFSSKGEYTDLLDVLLYAEILTHQERLVSGVRLVFPESFRSGFAGGGSIERRVAMALSGGWILVGLITDPGDLFLIPQQNIVSGKDATPDDAVIGRGVLQELRKRGLISLRGNGFKNEVVPPSHWLFPSRTASGEEWVRMIADQESRWSQAEITPVVDLEAIPWFSRSPLRIFLERYRIYVEPFDLMRIDWYLQASREMSNMEGVDKIINLIKGVLGEVAARPDIVKAYRAGGTEGRLLFVAPQILSGHDALERSDAVVARLDQAVGAVTLERVWEVVTTEGEGPRQEAYSQHAASIDVYRGGGIIFRGANGKRSQTFVPVVVDEGAETVVIAADPGMEHALAALREFLTVEMGIDLISSRAKRMQGKNSPTLEDLQAMIGEPGGIEGLVDILAEDAREDRLVLVGLSGATKVTGLRFVSEAQAEKFSDAYFHLSFDRTDGGWTLRSAHGYCSSDIALSWIEGRLGRQLDPVESSFLGSLLHPKARSYFRREEKTSVNGFGRYLQDDGIDRLSELMKKMGRPPPEGQWVVVVGKVRKDEVIGIRLLDEDKAASLSDDYFQLGFDREEGVWQLRSASGESGMNFALPWMEKKLGLTLDPAEVPFLALLLGTRAEEALTVEQFSRYLSKEGIHRFAKVMVAMGRPLSEGRWVVVGRVKKGKVGSVRLVSAEEAHGLDDGYFQLGFDWEERGWQLRSASGKLSLNLVLAWIEEKMRRKVEPVERAFLAASFDWSGPYDDPVTLETLSKYLENRGIDPLKELMKTIGQPLPEGRLTIAGTVHGGKLQGLQFADGEDETSAPKTYFRLGFAFIGGCWELRSVSRNHSLDFAQLWVSKKLGREIDPVERAFLAAFSSRRVSFEDPEEGVTSEKLRLYLRENGIDRLPSIVKVMGWSLPKGRLVIVGDLRKGSVMALRLLEEKEADLLSPYYFRVPFDPVGEDRYQLNLPQVKGIVV